MTSREEAIWQIVGQMETTSRSDDAARIYDVVVVPLLAEAATDALNSAAADWPDQGIVSLWLHKRAEALRGRS